MRILDFEVPNFKFPKIKMKGIEDLPEVNVDYDDIENKKEIKKLKKKGYPETHYKTIKEIFLKSTEKFADRPFILEKFNPKEPFTEITYKEFKDDVVALGTALTKKYNLKDERLGTYDGDISKLRELFSASPYYRYNYIMDNKVYKLTSVEFKSRI